MNRAKKIAVVGAGISGLACAYELQRAGHSVTVFEKESTVGGRMRSRVKDGLSFDIGATHLIPLYTHMAQYRKEFGLGWEQMEFEQYGLLRDGKIQKIGRSLGVRRMNQLRQLMNAVAKTKARTETFDLSLWTEYDTTNAYQYIAEHGGSAIADYVGDAFTAAYEFHRSDRISNAAVVAIMKSIQEDRNGWQLHHFSGGMSALPDALASRLDVRTDTAVEAVTSNNNGVQMTANGNTEQFDAVVLATTANISSGLLQNPTQEQAALLDSIDYASTISLAFRIPADSLPQFSITWIPFVENQVFSGISNEVMKGKDLRNQNGESLVCTWLHEQYAHQLLDKSDQEVFAIAAAEFVKMCPWFDSVDQLVPHDLERWTHAMPVFEQGLPTRVKTFLEHHQGVNNIYLCGDYLNSPWTEGALACGKRVAAEITAAA